MITIYTDGSFRPPNKGAWGALIIQKTKKKEKEDIISGSVYNTTISRMELTAIQKALEFVLTKKLKSPKVKIFSDSMYCVQALAVWSYHWRKYGWKTVAGEPVKNKDLFEKIDELHKKIEVTYTWVKAHSTCHGNNRIDEVVNTITKNM